MRARVRVRVRVRAGVDLLQQRERRRARVQRELEDARVDLGNMGRYGEIWGGYGWI